MREWWAANKDLVRIADHMGKLELLYSLAKERKAKQALKTFFTEKDTQALQAYRLLCFWMRADDWDEEGETEAEESIRIVYAYCVEEGVIRRREVEEKQDWPTLDTSGIIPNSETFR